MIFTSCCYCDTPFTVGYEAGDKGVVGYYKNKCEECGNNSFVELVSVAGQTLPEDDFFNRYPEAKQTYK